MDLQVEFRDSWYAGEEDPTPSKLALEDNGEDVLLHISTDDGMFTVSVDELESALLYLKQQLWKTVPA